MIMKLIQELLKALLFSFVFFNHLNDKHINRFNKWSADAPQTCSVWCDCVQFDSQGIAGLSVMLQGVTVAPAAIEEPLPTEHCSVCQVQPQVLPHLTLLTLPAADSRDRH